MRGLIRSDTASRDLFDAKLMGILTPRPPGSGGPSTKGMQTIRRRQRTGSSDSVRTPTTYGGAGVRRYPAKQQDAGKARRLGGGAEKALQGCGGQRRGYPAAGGRHGVCRSAGACRELQVYAGGARGFPAIYSQHRIEGGQVSENHFGGRRGRVYRKPHGGPADQEGL